MKIEICEQMVQAWLFNCKNCQVAQTNWSISPLKDIDRHKKDISDYIDYFVSALKNGVSSGKLDREVLNATEDEAKEWHKNLCEDGEEVSFMRVCQMLVAEREAAKDQNGDIDFNQISILGRAGKAKELQFVRQTEIDILGVELDNGQAQNIYLVDTAFHKDGLNYSDTVSSVTKKIIRAILVADIIFGIDVPVHIVFASPVCKPGPEMKIEAVKKYIEPLIKSRPTLHGKLSHVSIDLYLNQRFSEEIYWPLRCQIDKLYGGNDLFMRSLNLAKAAEENLPESKKAITSTGGNGKSLASPATPSGGASGSLGTASSVFSNDQKYAAAAYYLLHKDATLGKVQANALGIPEKQGNGNPASDVLHELGIKDTSRNSPNKGLLLTVDIDDAITDRKYAEFKKTLVEIKARGLHLKP